MDMPPSRYRVEERGRRLVVIDRASGHAVGPAKAPPRKPPRRKIGLKRPQATPDSFVTRSWFDAKAPRTIKLNYVAHSRLTTLRLGGAIVIALLVTGSFLAWPWFPILIGGILASQKSRSQLRKASTRWIDGFDQAD